MYNFSKVLLLFILISNPFKLINTQEFLKKNIISDGYKYTKCNISLNQTTYSNNESIVLNISIKNIGGYPIKLNLSNNIFHNILFDIHFIENNTLSSVSNVNLNNTNYSNISQSSITLNKSQFYGYNINLSDYYNLNKPGTYIVKVKYLPNLKVGKNIIANQYISSNTVKFFIVNKKNKSIKNIVNNIDIIHNHESPNKVVFNFLNNYLKKSWEKTFSYINFNTLIKQYPKFNKHYIISNPRDKSKIIANFKKYLKDNLGIDIKSKLLFSNFFIEKYFINMVENEAKVYVQVELRDYTLVKVYKDYIFYLSKPYKKIVNTWLINYWVINNYDF